jgi:hypothetical protein
MLSASSFRKFRKSSILSSYNFEYPAKSENNIVLTNTHRRADNSLACEFQTLDKKPLQAMVSNDAVFMDKINATPTDKFAIVFKNNDSTLLFITALQESLLLGEKVVERQQQNVDKMDSLTKTESLRKDLNLGELKVSDRQGDTLAINDYSVEIQTDGSFLVKKSNSYDLEKIEKEGFDGITIQATLDTSTMNQTSKDTHTHQLLDEQNMGL